MKKQNNTNVYKIWLGLAAFIIIIAGVKAASSIIVLFLLSVFIAIVSTPAIFWLEKLKMPRIFAFLIVLSAVVVVLFGFAYILSSSVDNFLSNTPQYQAKIIEVIDSVSSFLNKIGVEVSKTNLENIFNPASLLGYAGFFLKSFTAVISNSFVIFIGVTFMLFEISSFKTKLALISNTEITKDNPFEIFSHKINRYLAIKTVISLITGILVSLGLTIIGVDFALLLGLIAFLLNYIPSFGSILAAIPAILVSLVGLDINNVYWVIGLYLTINIILGNIIEPRYMGRNLGLSVVVVFFSLIFWGWVLGPVGMFLAVPISMTIKIALESHPSTKSIAILLSSIDKK